MPKVTIYGAPACMKCKLTKSRFVEAGIVPEYVEDPERAVALAEQYDLGRTLPVVHVVTPSGEQYWADFRAERIRAVIADAVSEPVAQAV